MSDSDTATIKNDGPYKESDEHVPEPVDQYGTLDTSGTAGSAHAQIEEVTPVFKVARRQAAIQAARAVDPDDPTPMSSVILPEEGRSRDDVIKGLRADADKVRKEPLNVSSGSLSDAQKRAAQKGDEGSTDAEQSRQKQGAGQRVTTEQTQGKQGEQTQPQSSDQGGGKDKSQKK